MSFLLLETGDKILQENGGGILLDIDFQDISQKDVDDLTALVSVSLGDFVAISSYDLTNMIAITSLNLNDFKVIADG